MRKLTDSERKTFDLAWLECLGTRRERGNDLDFFESGFISALAHADQQLTQLRAETAALTAERTQLRAECKAHAEASDGLREALAEIAAIKPQGLLARWLVDRARRALNEIKPTTTQSGPERPGETK